MDSVNLLLPLVAVKPRVLYEIERLPAVQPTPAGTKSYYAQEKEKERFASCWYFLEAKKVGEE